MISPFIPTIAGLIGCTIYYSPYAWRLYRVRDLRKRVTEDRTLILTYDDGPSSSLTPAILDLLGHHNAKATFFMLGQNAQQNMNIAHRVVEEGHDVGCHSHHHLNAWKVSPWRAIADINAGYDSLVSWVAPDGMYRPPYGKVTLPTYMAVRNRGARLAWWTIDSGDTYTRLPQPDHVADRVARDGGGIVLMHDLDRSKERNEFVLETTALLLNVAERKSLKIKRLSELCG